MNKRKGINHPPVAEKHKVFERDGHRCLYGITGCAGAAQTTDHRAGRGNGGSRVLNHGCNLGSACLFCNFEKERATGEARAELIRRGLTVAKAATNEQTLERARTTPIQDRNGDWWWLVDASTRFPALPVDVERHLETVKDWT